MDKMTVAEIIKAVNGKLLCGSLNTEIFNISINSKELMPHTLFIPLVGNKTDAHKFLDTVVADLNTDAVFTQKKELCNNEKTWIWVEDCHEALQLLAKYYRAKINIPIIGITGSVGKTTTKEMIYSVLSTEKKVFKTFGNQNSQIGVPLNILKIDNSYDIAVLEMGMSMFGEMQKLAEIAKPTHLVITNIGLSHIGNLKTQENIFKEKLHAADFINSQRNIYLNGNDKILQEYKHKKSPQSISFGMDKNNNIYADNIILNDEKTIFTLNTADKHYQISLNTVGEHHILNAMAAITLALDFNISIDSIITGVANFSNPAMRQQIYKIDGLTLIDDSYNASPDSVKSALAVVKSINKSGRSIAILADILELGDCSAKAHYDLGFEIIKQNIDILITIGTEAKNIAECVKNNTDKIQCFSFDNNQDVINMLDTDLLKTGDTILIKGSRGMHTDEIVNYLLNR